MSRFIEGLNDLLYDFDEFVDSENFEAEKFTELQDLSKKAGPRIFHIIRWMQLPPPHLDHDLESVSSSMTAGQAVMVRQPSDDDIPPRRESLPYPEGPEPDVKYATMPYPSAPNPDSPRVAHLPSVQEEEPPPPPPPFLDPWSQGSQNPSEEPDRRRDVIASSNSTLGPSTNSDYNSSPMITSNAKSPKPSSAVAPRSPNYIVTTAPAISQLEHAVGLPRYSGRDSISPIPPMPNLRDSVGSSTNASARSSVSDARRERDSTFDIVSPISPMNRTSGYSLDSPTQSQSQKQSPHVPPLFTRPGTSFSANSVNDGMETVILPMPSVPDGLIPVEVEVEVSEPVSPLPEPEAQLGGCGIHLDSSYYQFKGFCNGAMEITQGGLGVKHIKKQVSIYSSVNPTPPWLTIVSQGLATGNIEVAKCKACAYELEWKAVERDVNNEGTYPCAPVLITSSIAFSLT